MLPNIRGQLPQLSELSEFQRRYLKAAKEVDGDTVVPTRIDKEGWAFIENLDTVGNQGSGVWLDPNGRVHYGPGERGVDEYGLHGIAEPR